MKQALLTAALGGCSSFDGGRLRRAAAATVSGRLRRHLVVTTILVAVPLLDSGGEAYAACVASPSPTFVCSGANTAVQNVTANNANVSTAPGFSVTAAIGNGVNVAGNGHIRFTDDNASTITGAIDGLFVQSTGNDGAIQGAVTIVTNGTITGIDDDGIAAENYGSGDLAITASGTVTGGDNGIEADNSGTNLTITTGARSAVTGGDSGIDAENRGSGALTITASGSVTGESDDGIFAFNSAGGADLTITTGAGSVISGGDEGIDARNNGSGAFAITVYGSVTGENGDGIYARNNEDANMTITTGAGSVIAGGSDGINAENAGSGDVTITANGMVEGEGGSGIFALTSEDSTNLTITTGAGSVIRGGSGSGIYARNEGDGDLAITAHGEVRGGDTGIRGESFFDTSGLTITTGAGSVVTARGDAIRANHRGSGDLVITANGEVSGGGNGMDVQASFSDSVNLKVTTGVGSAVAGVKDGIVATSQGSGDLVIVAYGKVTGTNYFGINARHRGGDTAEIIITVGDNGFVEGGNGGILVISDDGQPISITNAGVVQNLSGKSSDRAIVSSDQGPPTGGPTSIVNSGVLIGTVELAGDFVSELLNEGVWNSAGGVSDFGIGISGVGNTGTFIAADDGAIGEATRLVSLEFFFNSGLVSLADGGAGDSLEMTGNYSVIDGSQGRLAVDALLGPTGQSDQLLIGVNTSGTTTISVNVVDVLGANLEGIAVVTVTGATAEEHFNLDGPLNAGFFTWDLRLDGKTHELFTTGIGVGAHEFAAGITGTQEIWHQTTGTLLNRQADLRSLLAGTSVIPVADYSEPVAPTPIARVTPGFWFKGVGAYVERDDEEAGFILDRRQTIFGGMAGFDFGTQDLGDALMFGVFAGYLSSDLKFDDTNTEWTYEGPSIGLYATYLDRAFHADVTVKADFLAIEIDPEDLASGAEDADTDAVNLGGRIDTGYKFGESVFVEPQASLAVVHTEIDDVDIFGGTVEFDDATSVRGRLGLRLGFDQPGSDGTVYSGDVTASLWEEFSGDNNVTIVDAGLPAFGADDPGAAIGDVSVGFSMAAPEGWSGFIRANYLFADDYEAVSGNAGLRLAW